MAIGNLTVQEWEQIEREEHDREYEDSVPHVIDIEAMLAYEDYCYKPGRRVDRGHRTRKAFDAIGLDRLKGKTILDVGCGNGKYSVLLALLGATVYGFDLSPVGVERAQALAAANGVGRQCHFSVQNALRMAYENDQFDILLLHEVLHHAIKYPNVKAEILRVLKPGGTVVITESLYGNPMINLGRMVTMRGKEAKGDVILTLEDLRKFGKGFSSCEIEMMSLLFMSKRIFEKHVHRWPVRILLYLVKKTDDVILTLFPFLRQYCGECVVVLKK
jgi:2-polyprenyl-3-methyl-5-hydroxy-6-metoxy-1,4-benzoquinol methylase